LAVWHFLGRCFDRRSFRPVTSEPRRAERLKGAIVTAEGIQDVGEYERRSGATAQSVKAKRAHRQIEAKRHFRRGKHHRRDSHCGCPIAANSVLPSGLVKQRRYAQRRAQGRDIIVMKEVNRLRPPEQQRMNALELLRRWVLAPERLLRRLCGLACHAVFPMPRE
jgi:hypothetical protein